MNAVVLYVVLLKATLTRFASHRGGSRRTAHRLAILSRFTLPG
jgi:hypothetical protein